MSGTSHHQHMVLGTIPNSSVVVDKVVLPADKLKGKTTVVSAGGNGPKNKNYCHKCCTKGHVMADCIAMLSCQICEGDDHVVAKCPQKRIPKPVAHMVGYAHDDLGFFYIPHGPIPMAKKDSTTAWIKVKGGHLSEAQLVGHLHRLVPTQVKWDLQLLPPDTWAALFHCKAELRRTVNFVTADIKDGMFLRFEDYEEEEDFVHELPSIGMRVTNLPRVLWKFEVLWAIGSICLVQHKKLTRCLPKWMPDLPQAVGIGDGNDGNDGNNGKSNKEGMLNVTSGTSKT